MKNKVKTPNRTKYFDIYDLYKTIMSGKEPPPKFESKDKNKKETEKSNINIYYFLEDKDLNILKQKIENLENYIKNLQKERENLSQENNNFKQIKEFKQIEDIKKDITNYKQTSNFYMNSCSKLAEEILHLRKELNKYNINDCK
jgi:chromosome segregation ATPase